MSCYIYCKLKPGPLEEQPSSLPCPLFFFLRQDFTMQSDWHQNPAPPALSLDCWNYRFVPPYLALVVSLKKIIILKMYLCILYWAYPPTCPLAVLFLASFPPIGLLCPPDSITTLIHIYMDLFLSEIGLILLVWWSSVRYRILWLILLCSLWLKKIPLCIFIPHFPSFLCCPSPRLVP